MGCEMNCAIGNRVGKPTYMSRLAFVESQYLVVSIHEWSKTQLYAPSVPETSKQMLGFTQSLMDVAHERYGLKFHSFHSKSKNYEIYEVLQT